MASINSTITIEHQRRPCMVFMPGRLTRAGDIPDREERAIFHTFVNRIEQLGQNGCQVQYVAAIVEYDDGTLDEVNIDRVRFLDSDAVFGEYVWPDMEHKQKRRSCDSCAHYGLSVWKEPCSGCVEYSAWEPDEEGVKCSEKCSEN